MSTDFDSQVKASNDDDIIQDWIDSFHDLIQTEGPEKAGRILEFLKM